MSDDIVKFLMPNGTEVSNDPRFDMEKAREEVLMATPNKGDVGITSAEQTAQTQTEHMANLNSGQPGVGPNATPEDPMDLIPRQGTGLNVQKEDVAEAKEAGGSPTETSEQDPEPVDSNEQVEEVRKAAAKRDLARKKSLDALHEAGEEEGSRDEPYTEWSSKQLKAEVARRNADGRDEGEMLRVQRGMRISAVAEMLEQDDQRTAATGTGEGPTGTPITQDTDEDDSDDE